MKPGNSLKSTKIRTRLSFSGLIYVLFTLMVGLAAVNSNNNILFLITSLLLSLLFLSGLTALYNLSGIRVRVYSGNVLTSNATGTVMVSVENSKRFSSLVLDVSLGNDSTLIPVIPPGKHKEVFLTWIPPHRGMPKLPRIRLTSSYPFGFVRRGSLFDAGARLVVSPGPAGPVLNTMPSSKGIKSLPGNIDQGRGEWNGIRQYRPGEGKASIVWKRIDWQKPGMDADYGQWPAHSFAQDNSGALILDWDDPLYVHLGTEKRLSFLRSALDEAVREKETWKLKLPHKNISGNGRMNYEQALQALALVKPLPAPG